MAGIIKGSINLAAIPKDKIIQGKKGKYLPVSITVNDEQDQFGNFGPIIVDQTKEEREAKAEKTYLGNVRVVWSNGTFPEAPKHEAPAKPAAAAPIDDVDLPF
jgi:hypothetical protein|tara:strand:+ start:659 stop:967 length:309 start_codon:yes stop_codon:yes gene_type:complete